MSDTNWHVLPPMANETQAHPLDPYVHELRCMMGLRDWTVIILHDEPPDPCWATVQRIYGQKRATICIRGDWREWEPSQLRQTLVHELMHLHVDPVAQHALNSIVELVNDDAYHVAYTRMMEDVEVAVDGIATAWADLLPLPYTYAKYVEEASA